MGMIEDAVICKECSNNQVQVWAKTEGDKVRLRYLCPNCDHHEDIFYEPHKTIWPPKDFTPQQCDNCKFYFSFDEKLVISPISGSPATYDGCCRRHSPSQYSAFPAVSATDWCGDYALNPIPAKPKLD